ncbi:MAG: hypothetical protein GC168_20445 [Candidatus Hydrogenedens sp.]|nr:hypothetical protein [Candidatus Hydrogenedens sp.]
MDLDDYQQAAWQCCEELAQELRAIDPETLADICRRAGKADLRQLRAKTGSAVEQLVTSAPELRSQILRKLNMEDRALILLLGLYEASLGWTFLQALCDRAIQAGNPHTVVMLRAADAARQLAANWPSLWPFSDFPSPIDPHPIRVAADRTLDVDNGREGYGDSFV